MQLETMVSTVDRQHPVLGGEGGAGVTPLVPRVELAEIGRRADSVPGLMGSLAVEGPIPGSSVPLRVDPVLTNPPPDGSSFWSVQPPDAFDGPPGSYLAVEGRNQRGTPEARLPTGGRLGGALVSGLPSVTVAALCGGSGDE
jgi:hypothetical protein